MDLTPDLLLEAKFAPARRGYDMNEVDDFLERCAEGLDILLTRLKSEFERAEDAEEQLAELRRSMTAAGGPDRTAAAVPVPAVDQPAGSTIDVPVDDGVLSPGGTAPEDRISEGRAPEGSGSERPSAAGDPDVTAVSSPVVEEPMRILIAAERTAEAAIKDARAEAQRIRAEAESVASTQRSEAEALLARTRAEAEAEARKAGEEARRTIESEVLSLRRDRDSLTHDIRSLRRWLDEQRSRLRTTARDLQRLVDDPAALRDLAVPELQTSPDQLSETVDDASAPGVPDDVGPEDQALAPLDADAGEPGSGNPESGNPGSGGMTEDVVALDEDADPTQAVPAVHLFDGDDDIVDLDEAAGSGHAGPGVARHAHAPADSDSGR